MRLRQERGALWLRAACYAAEGKVWELLRTKARRYAPISWCEKRVAKTDRVEALAFLVWERRHPKVPWDDRRPSPVPAPTAGTVGMRKKREEPYGGKPSITAKGVPPRGSRTSS